VQSLVHAGPGLLTVSLLVKWKVFVRSGGKGVGGVKRQMVGIAYGAAG